MTLRRIGDLFYFTFCHKAKYFIIRHLYTFQRNITDVRRLDAEAEGIVNEKELRISAEFSKKVIAVKVLSGSATLPKKPCKIKGF